MEKGSKIRQIRLLENLTKLNYLILLLKFLENSVKMLAMKE